MKNMQSSTDYIISKIKYNEILKGDIFDFGTQSLYKDSIIQLSDGSIFTSFLLITADSNLSIESDSKRSETLSLFFANLPDGYEINFELRRKKKEFEYIIPSNIIDGGTVYEIEQRRKREFSSSDNLVNETYITLIKRNFDKNFSLTQPALMSFIEKAELLKASLESAGCRVDVLKSQKLLDFIKYAYDYSNETQRSFSCTKTISESILNSNYELKNIPLVIKNTATVYTQCLTPTALASWTFADMFSFLSSLDFEIRLVLKYKGYSKEKAKSIIFHKKKAFKNSIFSLSSYMKKEMTNSDISDEYDHDAIDGKNQCDCALDAISQNDMSAGDTQITFILNNTNIDKLELSCRELKSLLNKNGFLIKEEKLGNTLCFISSLPASPFFYNSFFLLSKNFCDFLHLGSPTNGAAKSALLIKRTGSKAPLIYAKNLDGSLFYFSPAGEEGEKGHSFISGPTGSGKSALLSLMASSFLKYDGTRCIIIDRDLSSLELVDDNNGTIFYPCNDSTCFQPLYNAKKRKSDVIEFIKSICYISALPWSAKIQAIVDEAIEYLEEGRETMTMLYSIIKGLDNTSELLPALIPFVSGGEYEGLFDSDADNFNIENRLTLIETNKILKNSIEDKSAAIPFFIYIFTRLNQLFDDCKPTMLIIDEGWKILKNKTFSAFLEEWIKTLRKKNVDIVLSCTNIADITDSYIAESVISNTQTQIFFKDENAENELQKSNYKKIGLDEHCINLIASLPSFHPLIIQEGKLSVVDFRMQNILKFITTPNSKKKAFLCDE